MKKEYSVLLKGEGQLHEPKVRLEGVLINLWSTDGGVTWKNKVTIELLNELDIFMSCKAMTGTQWEFTIIDKDKKEVYKAKGETGERLDSQNGTRVPNYSERVRNTNQFVAW